MLEEEEKNQIIINDISTKEKIIINIAQLLIKDSENIQEPNEEDLYYFFYKKEIYNEKGTKFKVNEKYLKLMKLIEEYIKEKNDFIFLYFEKANINIMKIVFNGYINAELKNSEEKKNLLNTITNLIPLFFSKALYYYVYNNFSKIFRKYKSIENKEILFNKFCHIFDLWKLLYDIKDDDKMNSNYITFIGRSVLNLVNKNSAQNQFKEVDIYIEFEDGINLLNEKNNDFLLVNVFYTDYIQQNLRIEGIINDKDKEKINNIFIKIDNTSMNCVLDGDFEFDENNEEKINQIMKFNRSYNFEKVEILNNYIGKIKRIKIRIKLKSKKSPRHVFEIIPVKSQKKYQIINYSKIEDIELFFDEKSDITIDCKISKEALYEDIGYYGGMESFIPIIKIIKYFMSTFQEKEEKIKILNQILIEIIRYIIKFICYSENNFNNFNKILTPLLGALAEINHIYPKGLDKKSLYSHYIFSLLYIIIKSSSLPNSLKKSYMMITGLNNIEQLTFNFEDIILDINKLHFISYQHYITIIIMIIEFILIETNNINNIPKELIAQLFLLKKIIIAKKLEKAYIYSFLMCSINSLNYICTLENEKNDFFENCEKIENLREFFIENFIKIDNNLILPLTMMKIYFNLINYSQFLKKLGDEKKDESEQINIIQEQKEQNLYENNFKTFFETFEKISLEKMEKIQNIIISNLENYINNKEYLIKLFSFLNVNNFKSEAEMFLSELIDFHRGYHHLMKNIFIFNKFWSDKKLFYTEKKTKFLKYKLINYYTKNYQKPFIFPELDYKYSYPNFTNYKIKDDFYVEGENPDDYNFNLDCPEFVNFTIEYEEKIFDIIKNNLKMIIYDVCLVKKTHHIKGNLIICNNNFSQLKKVLFFSYPSKTEKNMPCCNDITKNKIKSQTKEKLCYGAIFSCPEKYKNIKLIINVKDIRMILNKIYFYKKSAIEIFTNNKSYYFNFVENARNQDYLPSEKKCADFTNQFAFFISEFFPIMIDKEIIIGYSRQFENMLIDYKDNSTKYDISIGNKFISSLFEHWTYNEKDIEFSTLDLLIYLNLLSNRSFNDLFQYPVFPALFFYDKTKDEKYNILERKLNQHIGFQTVSEKSKYRKKLVVQTFNESKREKKEDDDEDGFEEPSFFKTHYSNNFYVTNFLIRIFPFSFLSIELQGNGFDSPNRLFYSIEDTLYNISFMKSDLREMIPEFYYFPEILWNINKINFGKRGKGILVDDVEMPHDLSKIDKDKNINKGRSSIDLNNEYENSNYYKTLKFIEKMRNFLESKQTDIISWINIIFGPGQMYLNPKKKDLLFRKESYINYTDDKKKELHNYIRDTTFLASVEFGITPIQIISEEDMTKTKNRNVIYNQSMKENKDLIKSYIEDIKKEKAKKNDSNIIYLNSKYIYQISSLNKDKNNGIKSEQFKNIFLKPNMYIKCNFHYKSITIYGYKTGKIEVYKKKEIQELVAEIFDHTDEINHIYYNPRLNIFCTTSTDGFLNVYIFPNKLLTSIKNPNKSYFNLAFLSSNPFPSIIAIEAETLNIFSYTINGFKIKQTNLNIILGLNEAKKDLWICSYFNENGGTFKDRLICFDHKEKDNIYKCSFIKVPFLEKDEKSIDIKSK